MYKALPFFIFGLTILLIPSSVWAFGSSSTNYTLDAEFGNWAGSKSSTNYNLTDTGGGFAVGFGSSANYGTGSGFQYVLAEIREMTVTLSSNSINLGTLSTGAVTTASNSIEVDTNAAGGYQVTVLDDGNLRTGAGADINDVSGGTVGLGSEEYGLATSQSGQTITQDASCGPDPDNASAITTSAQLVASSSLPIEDDATILCYSASISGSTSAGSYSHVLTYITTGTF
ncbi:MAG: hypothetical protein WD231_04575 [Candidatus Woykebacteria bacterium]